MKIIHQTAEHVTTAKSGLTKHWLGRVLVEGTRVWTQVVWWQTKANGTPSAVQESVPAEVFGKNLGRKNATSPLAQAHLELAAEVKKLRDKKGYREVGEAASAEIPRPMTAEKYLERIDDITWPVFVQPKLDGHRAMFDGAQYTTRGGQLHKPHIQGALSFATKGLLLDGELMLDPKCPALAGLDKVERFQLSASAIKKDYPDLTPWVRYYVYDCVTPDHFSERYQRLIQLLWTVKELPAVLVPTKTLHTEAEVDAEFARLLAEGHEGAMIRQDLGGYELGHRSAQLLKLKPCDDLEFLVIDVVPSGKGKAAETGKFVCVTEAGVEFRANPRGTATVRAGYLENREEYIGRQVTVRFEGFSEEGKPRFPRVIGVREAWDQ